MKILIHGKTVTEWNNCWKPIGILDSADLSKLKGVFGLYRFKDPKGNVICFGCATESGRGLEKRITDFRRSSNSARDYKNGKYIYDHRDIVSTEVICIGATQDAQEITSELKEAMK
ncbi:hypothetical protein [Caproicibacterium sp. BJN0003]|uniref:hypothetical protein n=1 Tax=Caproicibacterium sp. BJN0003 TaxID=2994078 RepID=UPI00224F23EF|nr:hypothetical protein [Caproicibacterium sp. BJN0003]UZT82651.1 hypothetical protein OP489_02230 [Caproicibacterium sp. BJN0003]